MTARVLPDRPGEVVIEGIEGDGGRLSLEAPKNCVGEQLTAALCLGLGVRGETPPACRFWLCGLQVQQHMPWCHELLSVSGSVDAAPPCGPPATAAAHAAAATTHCCSSRVPTPNWPHLPPTAGIAAIETLKLLGAAPSCGVGLRLHKGLPLGSGMGSSAASAAAAAWAVNSLFGCPVRGRAAGLRLLAAAARC